MIERLRYWTRRISRHWVYTARSGLWAGMRRRGGFDFLPNRSMDKDAAFLKTLDFSGKVVYDIGAFEGLFSLFFARAVGEGQVISFEPVPKHHQLIEDHLHLNQIRNLRLIPFGIGANHQKRDLLICDEMGAYSTAHPQQKALLAPKLNCQEYPIEVYALDDLIPKEGLPLPNFIKIDVEGMEFEALQGMEKTITEAKPELFIELHGFDNARIAIWLLEREYKIWQVRDEVEITKDNTEMAKRFLYAYSATSSE
jgi:FkbM family methyltransferase